MTRTESSAGTVGEAKRGVKLHLIHQLPFLLLYILAVVGVSYTDQDAAASTGYWKLLIPITGLVAIVSGWPTLHEAHRKDFLIKQVLHWVAVYLVVQLLFLHVVNNFLNAEVHGFIVIYVLGLSAILAGIQWSGRLVVYGVFLVLSGIGFAFFEDEVLFISISMAVVVSVGTIVWTHWLHHHHRQKTD